MDANQEITASADRTPVVILEIAVKPEAVVDLVFVNDEMASTSRLMNGKFSDEKRKTLWLLEEIWLFLGRVISTPRTRRINRITAPNRAQRVPPRS